MWVTQFADVRLISELHHFSQLAIYGDAIGSAVHPADYCVSGDGPLANATTTVNDCYITAADNERLADSYLQPCYSPTGSLATMEGCSRRNDFEGYHAEDWTIHFEGQWAPGYTGPMTAGGFPPAP